MTLTQVSTGGIKDGQVHTADLADAQITAGKLHADALDRTYTLGADGSNHYTFTGEGLTGAVNDPTLYLTRGKTYRFVNGNSAGAHPFRIQTTVNGSAGTEYNTGVTNNGGAGGSTIVFEVPHAAPDVLYYQCTSHGAMGGILYVTGALADGTVTTAKLAADAVDGTKIADDSINSEHYVDGSIDTAHIADQAVDLTKLPHGTSSNDGKFLRANNGADPTFESLPSSGLSNIVEDTTPQLGGDLDLNGNIISVGDGGRDANQEHIRFGTDGDLRIYHTAGGDSTIEHNSSGTDLILKTGSSADDVLIQPQDDFLVQVAGATKNSIISRNDGATELYWQGSGAGKKFETTSAGATVTGTCTATAFAGDGSALTGIQGIPSGVIMIWSGAVNAIPTGFVLCNGQNSTPNLIDKFVVGAGSVYSVGATGGATSDTDTVNISISGQATVNTGGDNLYIQLTNSASHQRRINFSASDSDTVTIDTLPPYYALCYIMKT